MSLAQTVYETPPPAFLSVLDETIIRLVGLHNGVKDVFLTVAVLAQISSHDEIQSDDPYYGAWVVSKAIHRLIHAGRIVAIDCETPSGSFTYILPAGSRPVIAMPVYIVDNRTRH